jgi:hypothetical protein
MRSLLAEGVLRLASSLIVPSGCSHVDGEHAFDEPALMVDGSRGAASRGLPALLPRSGNLIMVLAHQPNRDSPLSVKRNL